MPLGVGASRSRPTRRRPRPRRPRTSRPASTPRAAKPSTPSASSSWAIPNARSPAADGSRIHRPSPNTTTPPGRVAAASPATVAAWLPSYTPVAPIATVMATPRSAMSAAGHVGLDERQRGAPRQHRRPRPPPGRRPGTMGCGRSPRRSRAGHRASSRTRKAALPQPISRTWSPSASGTALHEGRQAGRRRSARGWSVRRGRWSRTGRGRRCGRPRRRSPAGPAGPPRSVAVVADRWSRPAPGHPDDPEGHGHADDDAGQDADRGQRRLVLEAGCRAGIVRRRRRRERLPGEGGPERVQVDPPGGPSSQPPTSVPSGLTTPWHRDRVAAIEGGHVQGQDQVGRDADVEQVAAAVDDRGRDGARPSAAPRSPASRRGGPRERPACTLSGAPPAVVR